VKIADFGLARELQKDEKNINLDKNQRLPIKWLAPETMKDRICSKKTDVSCRDREKKLKFSCFQTVVFSRFGHLASSAGRSSKMAIRRMRTSRTTTTLPKR
jgi:serine/threonine protein kinase